MRRTQLIALTLLGATACGGSPSSGSSTESGSSSGGGDTSGGDSSGGDSSGEFHLSSSDTAGEAHGDHPSAIESTATHAAMRLFVVDPDNGPLSGVVIKMTGPDGTAYYTDETDSVGYAEVLVPAGQAYQMEYLSLGRPDVATRVEVPAGPRQDIRLTLRRRTHRRPRCAWSPARQRRRCRSRAAAR